MGERKAEEALAEVSLRLWVKQTSRRGASRSMTTVTFCDDVGGITTRPLWAALGTTGTFMIYSTLEQSRGLWVGTPALP